MSVLVYEHIYCKSNLFGDKCFLFLDSTFLALDYYISMFMIGLNHRYLCMRDKKESAVVLPIIVDTTHFMKESCE